MFFLTYAKSRDMKARKSSFELKVFDDLIMEEVFHFFKCFSNPGPEKLIDAGKDSTLLKVYK